METYPTQLPPRATVPTVYSWTRPTATVLFILLTTTLGQSSPVCNRPRVPVSRLSNLYSSAPASSLPCPYTSVALPLVLPPILTYTSTHYPPLFSHSPHRHLLIHPSSHPGCILRKRSSSMPPKLPLLKIVHRRSHSAIMGKGISYAVPVKCSCSRVACGFRMPTVEHGGRCASRLCVQPRVQRALARWSPLWALEWHVLRASAWDLGVGGKGGPVPEMTTTISTTRVLWQSRLHLWQVSDLYLSTKPFPGQRWSSASYASASGRYLYPRQQHRLETDLANVAARDISLLAWDPCFTRKAIVLYSRFSSFQSNLPSIESH